MPKYWVTDPSGYLEPRVEKSENGADAGRTPLTVVEVLRNTKEKFGNCNAMALKRGPKVC